MDDKGYRALVEEFQHHLVDQGRSGTGRGSGKTRHLIQAIGDRLGSVFANSGQVNVIGCAEYHGAVVRGLSRRARPVGSLIPIEAGFAIHVSCRSPDLFSPLERFTVAHEIGHIMFFEPLRPAVIPDRVVPAPSLGTSAHAREEGLCDAFARACLLPRSLFDIDEWRDGIPSRLEQVARKKGVEQKLLAQRAVTDFDLLPDSVLYRISNQLDQALVLRGSRVKRNRSFATGPELIRMLHTYSLESVCEAIGLQRVAIPGSKWQWLEARST